jgi:hypothetical protein
LDALLASVRSEETSTTINPAKFFDNDEYDDYYKELVDEGSIDDQNLSSNERQRGIAAFRSNKLDFKKFVTDIQSLKPEVEQLNQEPLTIKEQFFTAPKIEPDKLIPSKDKEALKIEPDKLIPSKNSEISEEFNEKLDELIAVIKDDNKLEEESQKFENREKQREKRKNRENRIENKKRTKLFSIDLKKGTGKVSNFFDDLMNFLTFAVLGGLVSGLYNFIMDPENNEKIEATQKFLKNNWPLLLGAAAYFLTPLGGLVNFLVKTIGSFAIRLGALILKHPLLAAALVGASALVLATADEAAGGIVKEMDAEGRLPGDPGYDERTKGKITLDKLKEVRPDLVQEAEKEGTTSEEEIEAEKTIIGDGLAGFSLGGMNMGTDTVPALLTPGEVVMNKPAVDAIGAESLLALNRQFGGPNANRPKFGKVPGYALGGYIGDNPPKSRDQSLLASNVSFGGNVNVSYGANPAQATYQSLRDAINNAISNPGQAQSASSEMGETRTTISGNLNLSGTFGGGNDVQREKKKKKKKEEESQYDPDNPKHRLKSEVLKIREERQAELRKENKFETKTMFAVPTGTGGRFNTSQASGSNKVSPFKPVGTNITGGTNFSRLKIIGDPTGPGSTGRVISEKRYDRLFGSGGVYAPDATGTRKTVPSTIGKPYAGSKMEMTIQNFGFQSSSKNARPVNTPNIPTETRNFMLPPVEVSSSKPNMGSNQM